MRLTLTSAALLAADTENRRLRGVAIPYGVFGNTSAGRLCVDAGAVNIPENLRAVKLFTEHGRQTPTGYTVEATDSPEQLETVFAVARTPAGDQALLEAAEGVRDALSVELDNIKIEAGHVVAADLVAVAQVALPAFAGAQLVATLTDEQQAGVNDLAQQIVDATAPTTEDTQAPAQGSETSMPTETTEAAAAPAVLSMTQPAAGLSAAERAEKDRRLWAAAAAEALRGATDAAQVNAALQDITPTSAVTGDAFPRPMWLGQLWTPQAADRPLINAIGVSTLTAMKIQGWKWVTEPEVSPYAGNKAAVPSSPAVIGPAEVTAQRIAGGWDIDRIYIDFNTGFLEAFQQAAVRDYKRKSQTYLIDGHPAITGPPAIPAVDGLVDEATDLGAQADLTSGVQAIVGFLTSNGANVSFIVMASDVYADFLTMKAADAPFWLGAGSSVGLNGQATVGGTTVLVDPNMAAGTILGGDRDAVTFWETGPINVTAVNLPNGGIDFGLFGYYAHLVHDDDGLATCQVTVAAGLTASTTAKKTTSSSS